VFPVPFASEVLIGGEKKPLPGKKGGEELLCFTFVEKKKEEKTRGAGLTWQKERELGRGEGR